MSVAEVEARELQLEGASTGGLWADAWRRLRHNRAALVGFAFVSVFVITAVFAWPGVGTWLSEAIFNRDYPVLEGGILS